MRNHLANIVYYLHQLLVIYIGVGWIFSNITNSKILIALNYIVVLNWSVFPKCVCTILEEKLRGYKFKRDGKEVDFINRIFRDTTGIYFNSDISACLSYFVSFISFSVCFYRIIMI